MDTHELAIPDGGQVLAPCNWPAAERPALVYVNGLAKGSQRTMRAALEIMVTILIPGGGCDAEALPWHMLRAQHTAVLRARLAERYKPATANKCLAALRGVLKAAWRLGQMTAEDYARACDLDPVRGSSLPRGRALSAGELRALFAACADDPTPAGRRDAALLAVLYGGGVRRAEAAALELADFDPVSGALTIRAGKGRKDRMTYLTGGAVAALAAWLELRGDLAGPLFWPMDKAGQPRPGGLSPQAVYDVCTKRAQRARVKDFSPHDLRRSFVSDLLDAGADVVSVQGLAGHANVSTTARYDRRGERAKARAAGLLYVPYEDPNTLLIE